MKKELRIWLWVSVALAAAGALMLYPIGAPAANAAFVVIKVLMVSGLLLMLIAGKKWGWALWAAASAGAVVMTLIKWTTVGGAPLLLGGSIFVDIFMPAGAYLMMKKSGFTR